MSTNAELIAQQLGGAIEAKKIWGQIIYNVKDFGARGDGTTDDTDSIQKALNAANAAGGGVVRLPDGVYRYSTILMVYSNITIEGNGPTTILKPIDGYPVSVNPWRAYGCFGNSLTSLLRNVTIRNLAIDGNNESNPGTDLINVQAPIFFVSKDKTVINENILLDNLTIHNTWRNNTQGVFGIMIENTRNVRIINCTVYDTGRDGINVSGASSDILVANNFVHDTQDDGISINPQGTHQLDTTCRQVKNVRIIGNNIVNAGARGISDMGSYDTIISGNTIDYTAGHGIYLSDDPAGDHENITISDNVVTHASLWIGAVLNAPIVGTGHGIAILLSPAASKDCRNITIVNNIVDTPAKIGIDINTTNDVYTVKGGKISNNIITNAGGQGIRFLDNAISNKGSKYIDILDNKINGSASRGIDVRSKIAYSNFERNLVLNSGTSSDIDGIYIGEVVDNCVFRNNLSTDDRVTKHQLFGITINANVTNTRIIDNDLSGNKSGAIYQPEKAQVVKGNIGYNPQGFSIATPPLPAGTAAANAITNSFSFPVRVYQNGGTGLHIIDINGNDVAVPGGNATTFTLEQGEKVYFATANTTSWRWYGQ